MSKIFFKKNRIVKVVFCDRTKNQVWEWVKRENAQGVDLSGFYYEGKHLLNGGKPFSREELEDRGFIIDNNNVVYNLPFVTVFLEHGEMAKRSFYDPEEAKNWAEDLMTDKGYSEIISYHD